MSRLAGALRALALADGVVRGLARGGSDARRDRDRAARPARVVERSTPLLALMLGLFFVGAPLVVLFDSTLVRVLGALALCGFIVAGVFLVADPAFLDPEDDDG